MRLLLIITLCLSFGVGNAQKTISKTISRTQTAEITRHIHYDVDNHVVDTLYTMHGRDYRYQSIISMIVIKRGSISDIYLFLKTCEDFLKAEINGTSSNIHGNFVSVVT